VNLCVNCHRLMKLFFLSTDFSTIGQRAQSVEGDGSSYRLRQADRTMRKDVAAAAQEIVDGLLKTLRLGARAGPSGAEQRTERCIFRSKATTHSSRRRPLIPIEGDH
jgi:hypothetical protein